jgi:hypothetical protein
MTATIVRAAAATADEPSATDSSAGAVAARRCRFRGALHGGLEARALGSVIGGNREETPPPGR